MSKPLEVNRGPSWQEAANAVIDIEKQFLVNVVVKIHPHMNPYGSDYMVWTVQIDVRHRSYRHSDLSLYWWDTVYLGGKQTLPGVLVKQCARIWGVLEEHIKKGGTLGTVPLGSLDFYS